MTRKTILFQAAPFCYGPISTTLNVARELVRTGHRLQMIDEGPTGDLIRRSGLPVERIPLATAQGLTPETKAVLRRADLVVSNTDPVFAAACIAEGIAVAVLDTLFWMWDAVPLAAMEADLYLCQDFPGVDAQLERLSAPVRFHRVGPLIAPPAPAPPPGDREPSVHVSLGGADCLLVDPRGDPYPSLMLRLLEDALQDGLLRDHRVVLCCGRRPADRLAPRDRRVAVRTLSNSAYLGSLRRARMCCLSPGLTGAMEAFEAETPVFFLPPQNYSQVLQLEAYRRAGAAPFGFAWSDVYPDGAPPPYLPEEEAVARVRVLIDRFSGDTAAQQALVERLAAFLGEEHRRHDPGPARAFRRSLGMDGPAEAARLIAHRLTEQTGGRAAAAGPPPFPSAAPAAPKPDTAPDRGGCDGSSHGSEQP